MADIWLNDAFDLIANQEGFSATPYWDVNAWRIGYGSDTVTKPDGTVVRVTKTTPAITKADGGRDLSRRIPEFAKAAQNQLGEGRWAPLSNYGKAAVLSTAYNYGSLPASVVKAADDPVNLAVAIAKLGTNRGINNSSRRVDEGVLSLRADAAMQPVSGTQMASNNDPFTATFGTRSARPALSAPGPTADDAFSATFGERKPAAPTAAQPTPAPVPPPAGTAPVAAGPINYGKMFGAQGTQVKRYVDDVVAANPSMTPQDVLADPTHQKAIVQRVPQAKAVFNADFAKFLQGSNRVGNAGLARGFQDVADTAMNWGMKGAAAGARGLAMAGALPDAAANTVGKTATDWETENKAGRDAYDLANPPGPNLLADPASMGRIAGQVIGTAPLMSPAVKGLGMAAEAVTSNPLVKSLIVNSGIGGTQAAAVSSASDAPLSAQVSTGAGIGAIFGLASPLVVKAGKTVFDKLFGSAYSDKALTAFAGYLKDIGLTPDQADKVVTRMGPRATYADLDEALRTEATALGSRGGETTSTIKGTFRDRAADASQRTAAAMDAILGPAPDVTQALADIKKSAQTAAGPEYKAAYAAGAKLNAQPVVDDIDAKLKVSKGATTTALQDARKLLFTGGKIDDSVELLHSARIELDAQIEAAKKATDATSNRRALSVLEDARGAIDKLLKTVPEMAAGDKTYAEAMRTKDAFEYGQTVFKNATRKEDLERFIAKATPEERAMLEAGARSAINDALENTSRGEALGAESLFGKKSANREKLAIVLPGKSDDVLDLVESNTAQRITEQRALQGSHTAELLKAQKHWAHDQKEDRALNPLIAGLIGFAHGDPTFGVATGLAYKAGTSILSKIEQKALDKGAHSMAAILTANPAERAKITNALMKNALRTKLGKAAEKALGFVPRAAPGTAMLLPRVVQPEALGVDNTKPRNVGRDLFAIPQPRL